MTKVKICGLMTAADIDAANALHPDYVGFVFDSTRRRYVSPATAAALRARLAVGILPVGVFVRAPVELPAQLAAAGIIDVIQLHGGEDTEYIAALRRLTDRPIVQAFHIDGAAAARAAADTPADFPLLDNGAGGTGQTFDHSLLHRFPRPFFLAGGLDECNVGEAVKQYRPYAVDVSSGVETDGRKNFHKIDRFIQAVRQAKP